MQLSSLLLACAGPLTWSIALAASTSQVLLPKPTGLYQVGRSVAELVDSSRLQPFVQVAEPRKLMISLFYPVLPQHPPVIGKYMLPDTAQFEDQALSVQGVKAPKGTLEKVALYLASDKAIKNLTQQPPCQYPLAIFMPAEGTTRLFYNQIASTIASTGYTVVTIDPPYDVDIVEFTDGSFAYINLTIWDTKNNTALAITGYTAIETRVQDVSFVLTELSNATLAHSLIPNLPQTGLNTTHTAMFGHSLGGAAAFSILEADDRVLGGLDMDGGLYGPGLTTGTSKPFMLMGHAGHTRESKAGDPELTWEAAWPHLMGWKRDVIIADTMHYDFSDYPIVFETLGITPKAGGKVANAILLGGLKGTRALDIVTSYVGAFLDFVIYGKCSALLDGPVAEFPEVTFEY